MLYRIEAFRSDVHPEGEASRVVFSHDFVQITYDELRIGPEGQDIAYYDSKDGSWHFRDSPGEWYSDITVTAVP